jgi:hypothetical protein
METKILFLFANPGLTEKLDQDGEYDSVRDSILSSRFGYDFKLSQIKKVSLAKLRREFSIFQPQVVHFSGHGDESGILIFQDSYETPETAPIDTIADVFRIHNNNPMISKDKKIRLVVLSACYSDKQAKAIAKSVDVVIGMQNAVREDAATTFASEFYSQLGFGSPVQTAFESGKNQVALLGIPDQDIPRLESRQGVDSSVLIMAGANLTAASQQTKHQLTIYTRLQPYSVLSGEIGESINIQPISMPASDICILAEEISNKITSIIAPKMGYKTNITINGSILESSEPISISLFPYVSTMVQSSGAPLELGETRSIDLKTYLQEPFVHKGMEDFLYFAIRPPVGGFEPASIRATFVDGVFHLMAQSNIGANLTPLRFRPRKTRLVIDLFKVAGQDAGGTDIILQMKLQEKLDSTEFIEVKEWTMEFIEKQTRVYREQFEHSLGKEKLVDQFQIDYIVKGKIVTSQVDEN